MSHLWHEAFVYCGGEVYQLLPSEPGRQVTYPPVTWASCLLWRRRTPVLEFSTRQTGKWATCDISLLSAVKEKYTCSCLLNQRQTGQWASCNRSFLCTVEKYTWSCVLSQADKQGSPCTRSQMFTVDSTVHQLLPAQPGRQVNKPLDSRILQPPVQETYTCDRSLLSLVENRYTSSCLLSYRQTCNLASPQTTLRKRHTGPD